MGSDIRAEVSKRYARIAQSPAGGACGCGCGCHTGQGASKASERIGYEGSELAAIPLEADLGLGCGNPTAFADLQAGETVVDLGSGGGIDCFLAARKVGPSGRVIGVDMTREMIDRARGAAAKGGYANVEFRLGEIENLPLRDGEADVLISNCVINLSPDKARVFREAFRALKPGGRLHVSDIVLAGELPEKLRANLELWAGCVSGAIPEGEYLGLLQAAGFEEVAIASRSSSSDLLDADQIAQLRAQAPELSEEEAARLGSLVQSVQVRALKR